MISKNGVALVVVLVKAALAALSIETEPGTVERAVEGVVLAGALIALAWHQVMERNTKWVIFK